MDTLFVYVATALDCNFSIFSLVARMHKKHSIWMAKRTISLKLGGRLVQPVAYMYVHVAIMAAKLKASFPSLPDKPHHPKDFHFPSEPLGCQSLFCALLRVSGSVPGRSYTMMKRLAGVRTLCPTRWTVRAGSLASIIENYDNIKVLWEAALRATGDTEMKARIQGVRSHFQVPVLSSLK